MSPFAIFICFLNLTTDLLSQGVCALDHNLLTDPEFCGEFESILPSGFRSRNGELEGSAFSGSEDYKSPFRGARPKLISYSESAYPKAPSTHFLVPTCILGPIYRAEPLSGRNSSPAWAPAGPKLRFGSVNRPQSTRGYQGMRGSCFQMREAARTDIIRMLFF